jgi:predicted transcriptional regulator
MTKSLIAAGPEEEIGSALQKMQSQGCRHLPVVDEGNLVGMLSLRDLLKIDDDHQRARASFLSELVTYSPDYDS